MTCGCQCGSFLSAGPGPPVMNGIFKVYHRAEPPFLRIPPAWSLCRSFKFSVSLSVLILRCPSWYSTMPYFVFSSFHLPFGIWSDDKTFQVFSSCFYLLFKIGVLLFLNFDKIRILWNLDQKAIFWSYRAISVPFESGFLGTSFGSLSLAFFFLCLYYTTPVARCLFAEPPKLPWIICACSGLDFSLTHMV